MEQKGSDEMSKAMYDALMEIAENGERLALTDLNVSQRMVVALAKRGFVAIAKGRAVVTDQAWAAAA